MAILNCTKYTSFKFLTLAGSVLLSLALPSASYASMTVTNAALTTKTCNATYYESLKSRAWLESQRKMRQVENYIFKPDSVLDYACFDIESNIAAKEIEEIFSEYHSGHCFPDALDCALQDIVISTLEKYQTSNFNHSFLGGHSGLSRVAHNSSNRTMCSVMKDVWALAKCRNFAENAGTDGFLSFKDYASTDPRLLPTACSNNKASDWNDHLTNAFKPTAATAWYKPMTDAAKNVSDTQDQYLKPGDDAKLGCGSFIRSGISIKDTGSIFFRVGKVDGVCSNPACTPDTSNKCVLVSF